MAISSDVDILEGVPPTGALRTARRSPSAAGGAGQLGMPRPGGGALTLTGALGKQSLMSKMMMLETLVNDIGRELPETANAFAPAIQMMRDLGAARLADQSGGGPGASNPEAAAIPGGPAGMPGAAPPAAGAGMMPPPPPML